MPTFRRILATVNPVTLDTSAARRAAYLAGKLGASLHLHCVVRRHDYARELFHLNNSMEQARQDYVAQAQDHLKQLAGELGVPDTTISSQWRHPFDAGVVEAIDEYKPDLVVTALRNDDHPSTAEWRLVRSCPVPLLVARHREWSESPYLMACLDPTHAHDKPADLDRKLVDAAAEIGAGLGVNWHVLHAVGVPPELKGSDPTPDQFRKEQEELRTREIRSMLPEDVRRTVELHFPHTTPVEAISAFADARHVDLVVMGSLARSRIKDLLIGSTLRGMLASGSCDLLLIHPDKPN
ncbi:MAG: universal stress protein [Xanthomonadales bacterium]|nr:universal stress protein [Xanthomonadales bacterium]